VQTSFWLKPVKSEEPADIPASATAVFYVNTNGNVVAYSNTTATTIADFRLLIADWNKVEIESDYVSKVWKLTLNGTNLFDNFAFYSDSLSAFEELRIVNDNDGSAFVDSIAINPADQPDPSDLDADGLPDDWELYFFVNLDADPGDLAANGVNTVMECYIAGIDPTDANAAFVLSGLRPLSSASILQWQNASGRVYSVYWSSNLLSGFDLLHSNYTGGVFTDSVHGTASEGFYKIEVQVQE
jgi:hypothetical protein